MYKAYFNCYLGDQDKSWAPNVCCLTCVKTLSAWYARKNVHMKFVVPMIWREQKDHSNDWYFCQDHFTGCATAKEKKHIIYPNLQSAKRPVEHSENYLCPNLPIKKWRVPAVLMNIPVVNMWSPMIQKARINQHHFLKRF